MSNTSYFNFFLRNTRLLIIMFLILFFISLLLLNTKLAIVFTTTIAILLTLLKSPIYYLVLLIVMTLIVAAITLLERKALSLSQRRVGPNFVGYKGRLQYLADALKLFLKGFIVPIEINKFLFIFCPSLVFTTCYTFWANSAWGLNIGICEIEFNIVYANLLSAIFSLAVVLTGFVSRNKYAYLASVRSLLMVLNLEIILGLFLITIAMFSKTLSIFFFAYLQETNLLLFNYLYIIGMIVVLFFLETGRAPFDMHEAESELVSGYNTEYGGFFFALYYLGEYFHLLFFASFISVTLLGFDNVLPFILKYVFL